MSGNVSRAFRLLPVAILLSAAGCGGDGSEQQGRTPMPSQMEVRAACTSCHVFAPPEILPRAAWIHAIRAMYQLAEEEGAEMPITFVQAAAWYLEHAPERLPPAPGRTDAGMGALGWERSPWTPEGELSPSPAVTHVAPARLFGGRGDDLLISDAALNRVYAVQGYLPGNPTRVLGEVPQPARLAVADLDGDGRLDVVVGALGQLRPTNDPVGSVIWLHQQPDGTFRRQVLADGLGRVADVRAVDLTGNGRLDLLVAAFGWQRNGRLLWLENVGSSADGTLRFREHTLDPRPGFTDVRAADLTGDGRLEIVALVTQASQQVMVYRQAAATTPGQGPESSGPESPEPGSPEASGDRAPPRFHPEVAFAAPHPDWGFSGLEVVDFTGDGRLDLVVTNGDGLDITVAKPHHGVALLENRGDGTFTYRHLTHMYGAHRAAPVDLNGNGMLDLVVAAYVPPALSLEVPSPPEALVWLERVGPTSFVRRVLGSQDPVHMTLAVGDFSGSGRMDLAAGSMDLGVADEAQAFSGPPLDVWVIHWRNLGPPGNGGPSNGTPSEGPAQGSVVDWMRDPI